MQANNAIDVGRLRLLMADLHRRNPWFNYLEDIRLQNVELREAGGALAALHTSRDAQGLLVESLIS